MSKLKYVGLLICLLASFALVYAQESAVAITLERTACFGTCPIYTLTIHEDGTVIYNGSDFVTVKGEQTTTIPPETVQAMVDAFAEAGYFEWDEAYTNQTVTDLPTIITSVTRDGETHRIERYAGDDTAPLALPFLENWIDEMVTTSLWTGVQPDPGAVSNGTDTAFITLMRDPCFGFCPVYRVAVYENGTVVFIGIANVEKLGVHVFETEPAAIASIVPRAQAFGYFELQDEYTYQAITDQAYVTTSIRWEDQYKRILRYDGDPNAPVGLVWVEEIIDLLVTDYIGSGAAQ